MTCDKCESEMESMGYGDMICSKCGYTSYSESDEDFSARTGYDVTGEDDG
jgi:tRNA(Ile2) C34 agmatinyltransferase TiaS